jgi:hypothetical protein
MNVPAAALSARSDQLRPIGLHGVRALKSRVAHSDQLALIAGSRVTVSICSSNSAVHRHTKVQLSIEHRELDFFLSQCDSGSITCRS